MSILELADLQLEKLSRLIWLKLIFLLLL